MPNASRCHGADAARVMIRSSTCGRSWAWPNARFPPVPGRAATAHRLPSTGNRSTRCRNVLAPQRGSGACRARSRRRRPSRPAPARRRTPVTRNFPAKAERHCGKQESLATRRRSFSRSPDRADPRAVASQSGGPMPAAADSPRDLCLGAGSCVTRRRRPKGKGRRVPATPCPSRRLPAQLFPPGRPPATESLPRRKPTQGRKIVT